MMPLELFISCFVDEDNDIVSNKTDSLKKAAAEKTAAAFKILQQHKGRQKK